MMDSMQLCELADASAVQHDGGRCLGAYIACLKCAAECEQCGIKLIGTDCTISYWKAGEES